MLVSFWRSWRGCAALQFGGRLQEWSGFAGCRGDCRKMTSHTVRLPSAKACTVFQLAIGRRSTPGSPKHQRHLTNESTSVIFWRRSLSKIPVIFRWVVKISAIGICLSCHRPSSSSGMRKPCTMLTISAPSDFESLTAFHSGFSLTSSTRLHPP